MSKRKLVLDNHTAWDNRDLRSVMLKVINENIKYEGPLRNVIQCRVVHSRRGGFSGYAYYHSGRMTVRVPKPSDKCPHCTDGTIYGSIIDGELSDPQTCSQCGGSGKSDARMLLNVPMLAHLFEHELAHCRGYRHKGMCSLNGYRIREGDYAYLEGMTIKVRQTKPKPVVDLKRLRYDRTLKQIAAWQTKEKRAKTALKKLVARRARYEKVLDV